MDNQIIKYNPNSLTPQESKVLKAVNAKKMIDFEVNEFISSLKSLILEIETRLKSKTENDPAKDDAMIAIIMDDLRTKYGHYSFQDVKIACTMACNGELPGQNPVIYFSPSNLMQWLKIYTTQVRGKLQIETQKQIEKQKEDMNKPSKEERKKLVIQAITEQIDRVRAKNYEWVMWGMNDGLALAYYDNLSVFVMSDYRWKKLIEAYSNMRGDAMRLSKIKQLHQNDVERFKSYSGSLKEAVNDLKNNAVMNEVITDSKKQCVRDIVIAIAKSNSLSQLDKILIPDL